MLHLYKETFNISKIIGPDFTGPIYIENIYSEFFHYDIEDIDGEDVDYFYIPGSSYNGIGIFIDDNIYDIFNTLKFDIMIDDENIKYTQSIIFLRKNNTDDMSKFCKFIFYNDVSIRSNFKEKVKNMSLCDKKNLKVAFYNQEDFSKFKMLRP